ncbi:MAG: divalent-cation tolerance protein CutA [Planctomycetota bacterium]
MSASAVLLLCTAPEGSADEIARALVDERLAACVTALGPARSIYRWKGAVERSEEIVLLVKTSISALEALRSRILDLHPYEVPEILEIPLEGGHQPYLDWVVESVRREGEAG